MHPDTEDGERFELDDWFTRFMRARRNEIASVSMIGAGVFVLGATLTYDPLDPSLNAASGGSPSNAFGQPGAIVADLGLQSLGWAGAALGAMLVAWGVILLARGPRRRGPKIVTIRIFAAALALSGFAAAASSLPVPNTWPFAVGLGGVFGDAVHGELASWLAAVRLPIAETIAGLIGLAGALLGLFAGYGVTPRDIADAAETGRRMVVKARRTVRHLAERYVEGLDDEVVRLEPIEGPRRTPALEDPARAARPSYLPAPGDDEVAPVAATARRSAARADYEAELDVAPVRTTQAASTPSPIVADPEPASPDPEPLRVFEPRPMRPAPVEPRVSPLADKPRFMLPSLDLLSPVPERHQREDETLEDRIDQLEGILTDFGVKGSVVNARPGPVVTLFEFEPAPGVRSSRLIGLADDIARSMSAVSARVAVVPGRNVIGIELPNETRETVHLRSLLDSATYADPKSALPLALGETIGGEPFATDLARMPHLLIAGTTGSGKSVGINAMILSLMFRLTPEECRFIMIDPKMLELSVYDGAPHLLTPVVTDPKKAVSALKWTVREMESRFRRMSKLGVRNIAGYNRRVSEAAERGEGLCRTVQTGYDQDTGKPVFDREEVAGAPMPYIVVVIDEMADLMLVAGKDIEAVVQRLAQMARAAGIHLIAATQRPSVDVITGTIKANFPTRISYAVTSRIDSRTILGEQGAEQLLGQGDLLHMVAGGRVRRLHGPFVSDEDVERVAMFLKSQGEPEYLNAIPEEPDEETSELLAALGGGAPTGAVETGDELLDRAIEIVARDRRASTSYLQRRLGIGYNRAASLMERLEEEGVVSPANAAGKREVLIPSPAPVGPGVDM